MLPVTTKKHLCAFQTFPEEFMSVVPLLKPYMNMFFAMSRRLVTTIKYYKLDRSLLHICNKDCIGLLSSIQL